MTTGQSKQGRRLPDNVVQACEDRFEEFTNTPGKTGAARRKRRKEIPQEIVVSLEGNWQQMKDGKELSNKEKVGRIRAKLNAMESGMQSGTAKGTVTAMLKEEFGEQLAQLVLSMMDSFGQQPPPPLWSGGVRTVVLTLNAQEQAAVGAAMESLGRRRAEESLKAERESIRQQLKDLKRPPEDAASAHQDVVGKSEEAGVNFAAVASVHNQYLELPNINEMLPLLPQKTRDQASKRLKPNPPADKAVGISDDGEKDELDPPVERTMLKPEEVEKDGLETMQNSQSGLPISARPMSPETRRGSDQLLQLRRPNFLGRTLGKAADEVEKDGFDVVGKSEEGAVNIAAVASVHNQETWDQALKRLKPNPNPPAGRALGSEVDMDEKMDMGEIDYRRIFDEPDEEQKDIKLQLQALKCAKESNGRAMIQSGLWMDPRPMSPETRRGSDHLLQLRKLNFKERIVNAPKKKNEEHMPTLRLPRGDSFEALTIDPRSMSPELEICEKNWIELQTSETQPFSRESNVLLKNYVVLRNSLETAIPVMCPEAWDQAWKLACAKRRLQRREKMRDRNSFKSFSDELG
ncbi:unnamed protein product [Cylindrotheca closterium]|uniref:Uncharacterized protein n=1 Tax=Cylindrotheca closterium TaxID=2856 RepID=A0AAD2FE85_9STRA|nr:unnamed protein product [Cylindrotheca closterium]